MTAAHGRHIVFAERYRCLKVQCGVYSQEPKRRDRVKVYIAEDFEIGFRRYRFRDSKNEMMVYSCTVCKRHD